MKTLTPLLAALLLSALAPAALAQAQRYVVINGARLNAMQLATLQRMNCAYIPNGAYWLNPRTGAWGYAGHLATRGHLGDACRGGGARRKSLSERGLLYTPGDLNFR